MEKDEKRLTEHFRMDEFVYSAMAVELGLNNALPRREYRRYGI